MNKKMKNKKRVEIFKKVKRKNRKMKEKYLKKRKLARVIRRKP